jgi:hypothetical protein
MIRRELFMATGANRTPLELVPEGEFDELWIAACSPNGIMELTKTLAERRRQERLVVVTPGTELPAGRWTMDWATLGRTIEIGRRDMIETVARVSVTSDSLAHGACPEALEAVLRR